MPPEWYEIRVQGELPSGWSDWFDGLEVRPGPHGESILSGLLADQAALYGVLARIRDLNLSLISVTRRDLPLRHSGKQGSGQQR
jgi:hypothetical protein